MPGQEDTGIGAARLVAVHAASDPADGAFLSRQRFTLATVPGPRIADGLDTFASTFEAPTRIGL